MSAQNRTEPRLDEAGVPLALAVSPHGVFHLDPRPPAAPGLSAAVAARIAKAFTASSAQGLLHLAVAELTTDLPPSLAFSRELAKLFFTRLCGVTELDAPRAQLKVAAPSDELDALATAAPPMTGAEYLDASVLEAAWRSLEAEVGRELCASPGSLQDYLRSKSPLWNAVGRVHFHLAENKRDELAPFAFLATYATRLSRQGRIQHAPLGRAIEEYAAR